MKNVKMVLLLSLALVLSPKMTAAACYDSQGRTVPCPSPSPGGGGTTPSSYFYYNDQGDKILVNNGNVSVQYMGIDLSKINSSHHNLVVSLAGAGVYLGSIGSSNAPANVMETIISGQKPSSTSNFGDAIYKKAFEFCSAATVAVVGYPWLITGVSTSADDFWGPDPAALATRIQQALKQMASDRKLILIGKSLGACKLTKVVQTLNGLGVAVDLLALVDGSCSIGDHQNEKMSIPANVKAVYNLRQTSPSPYNNNQNGYGVSFSVPTIGYDIKINEFNSIIGKILCPPNPDIVGHDGIDERPEIQEFISTVVGAKIANLESMSGAAGWINLKNDKWHDWFSPVWEKSAVGDFNGDNIDDIATANASGNVYVCYSTKARFGSGGSSPEPIWFSDANFKSSYDLLAGDFNGDKKDELISFRKDNGYYYIKGNAYTTTGLTAWKSSKSAQTVYLAVTDLDNNGYDELVGTYLIPSPRSVHMTILYESGPVNKVTHMGNDFAYDQYFGPITFGDVTKDGIKDMISLVPDGYSNYTISWVQLYKGAKDAADNVRFTFIQRLKGPAIDAGSQVVASDFDNDGVCDVIMSGNQQTNGFRTIRAFQGSEALQPWEIPGLIESLPNPKDYSLPDVVDAYPTTINAGRFAHQNYNDLIYFNKGYEADAFIFQVRDANDIKSIAR